MKSLFTLALLSLTFLVNAQCNIDIQWTSSVNGGNITFNNVSTGVPSNPSFAWLYDGQSSSVENPTFPYNAGVTQVCFAIYDIDSSACQDSICGLTNIDSCFLDISWTSVVAGGDITFTNTSTGMPLNPAFAWLYDGQGSSVENPTFTYNPAAPDVCFAIYDIDNPACEDSICGPAVVDSCDLDLAWVSCVGGGNIGFNSVSTGVPSNAAYAWLYDGQSSSSSDPLFTYNPAATQVCLAIYDIDNPACEDSICGPINDTCNTCALDISWVACVGGGTIGFNSTSTGVPSNAAYAWLYDGQSSSSADPVFTYNPAATEVCLAIYDIDNPACEDSICGPINDTCACALDISWTSTIVGGDIIFTNTSTGTPSNAGFAWLYNGQGSSVENPTFPYNDSITEVCFAIYDIDDPACEDSICGPLTSDSTMFLTEPLAEPTFKLFPNPAANELNIQIDNFQSDYEIRILDMTGRMVYTMTLTDQNTLVDISQLDQGGYLLYLLDKEKPENVTVEKFLKQ